MTSKEIFIKIVEKEIFSHEDIYIEQYGTEYESALKYFNELKADKKSSAPKPEITENGVKILRFMQENYEKYNNVFKSKEIGEGLFVSSRSVSGSMKKLITDGFVNKIGTDPVAYEISQKGLDKDLDSI